MRINEYPVTDTVTDDDYIIVDSETSGSRKYKAKGLGGNVDTTDLVTKSEDVADFGSTYNYLYYEKNVLPQIYKNSPTLDKVMKSKDIFNSLPDRIYMINTENTRGSGRSDRSYSSFRQGDTAGWGYYVDAVDTFMFVSDGYKNSVYGTNMELGDNTVTFAPFKQNFWISGTTDASRKYVAPGIKALSDQYGKLAVESEILDNIGGNCAENGVTISKMVYGGNSTELLYDAIIKYGIKNLKITIPPIKMFSGVMTKTGNRQANITYSTSNGAERFSNAKFEPTFIFPSFTIDFAIDNVINDNTIETFMRDNSGNQNADCQNRKLRCPSIKLFNSASLSYRDSLGSTLAKFPVYSIDYEDMPLYLTQNSIPFRKWQGDQGSSPSGLFGLRVCSAILHSACLFVDVYQKRTYLKIKPQIYENFSWFTFAIQNSKILTGNGNFNASSTDLANCFLIRPEGSPNTSTTREFICLMLLGDIVYDFIPSRSSIPIYTRNMVRLLERNNPNP